MCHLGTVIYKGFLCKLNENIVITPDVFPLCHSLTLFRGFRNEFQCSWVQYIKYVTQDLLCETVFYALLRWWRVWGDHGLCPGQGGLEQHILWLSSDVLLRACRYAADDRVSLIFSLPCVHVSSVPPIMASMSHQTSWALDPQSVAIVSSQII